MKRIPVSDPPGAATDPAMPWLRVALDPVEAMMRFQSACPRFVDTDVELCAIRVTRHKPGRRCVVEYDLQSKRALPSHAPGQGQPKFTLLGKIRAKGLDKRTPQLLEALFRGGFDAGSADEISVPEVAGVIAEFRMWLQVKVPGAPATDLLAQPNGAELAGRIADAAHKLHATKIDQAWFAGRVHTMEAELAILQERLLLLARARPELA